MAEPGEAGHRHQQQPACQKTHTFYRPNRPTAQTPQLTQITMFVYIIHFDTPLEHAQHYVGSTQHLRQRLFTHANRNGARITAAAGEAEIPWCLGNLFQTTQANGRRVEVYLKDQRNTARFCRICNEQASAPPNSKSYPLELVNFETRSDAIIDAPSAHLATVETATDDLDERFAIEMQRHLKVELGFLTHEALHQARTRGHLVIARQDGERVGFAVYTREDAAREIKIHQCAVEDAARLRKHGRQIIETIGAMHPMHSLNCKVRTDLPANGFWEAIGFSKIRTEPHTKSGQPLNHYHRRSSRQ